MVQLNFNASEVPPSEPLTLIPAGEYPAWITESEMQATKSGTGQYLKLTFDITDGEFKGRKLWAQLNLVNPNPQAVQIAQRELSAICHAVGHLGVTDSGELHLKPLIVVVKVQNDPSGQHEPRNEIKGFKPVGQATPGYTPPPAAQPAPVQQTAPAAAQAAPVNQPAYGAAQAQPGQQQSAPPPAATGATTPPWRQNATA